MPGDTGTRAKPSGALAVVRKVSASLARSLKKRARKWTQRKTVVRRHPTLDERTLASGRRLVRIQEEVAVSVFEGGDDRGYHNFGARWWTNPACPHALQYLSLDSMYPAPYFDAGRGHPSHAGSSELYRYMQEVYAEVFGAPFASVLELGTGGGEITRHFAEAGLDFVAVEGTAAGVRKLVSLDVAAQRILQQNLKFLKPLGRRFDLAMCTEVAEHIEPWFASKVVSNCVEHADVVWFSAAKGEAQPHYHHINETPLEAWDNLFAHFGYNSHIALNGALGRADRLYLSPTAAQRAARRG